MTLNEFFSSNNKVALAFSGGTDSAYLLYAAVKNGAQVQPYFIKTDFQPNFEFEDAKKLCRLLSVELRIINVDILSDNKVAENSNRRCYYCKRALFTSLSKAAEKDGFSCIIDGTNASDSASDRPGMAALRELGIRSPLRECGLSKEDIRRLSHDAAIFTWNKPAYACLATRIECGEYIQKQALVNVENAENALFELGFSDFRVRVFHNAALLQFPEAQYKTAAEKRNEILKSVSPFFERVFTDTRVR